MPSPCPHAERYASAVAAVAAGKTELQALFKSHRRTYDDFHGRIAKLPTARQAEFADKKAIVDMLEAKSVALAQARDALPTTMTECMASKMADIAAARGAEPHDDADCSSWAEEDFSAFREWRKTSIDGVDVDLLDLCPRGKIATGKAARLFDRLLTTWAKSLNLDVETVRVAVMESRAAREPEAHFAPL